MCVILMTRTSLHNKHVDKCGRGGESIDSCGNNRADIFVVQQITNDGY